MEEDMWRSHVMSITTGTPVRVESRLPFPAGRFTSPEQTLHSTSYNHLCISPLSSQPWRKYTLPHGLRGKENQIHLRFWTRGEPAISTRWEESWRQNTKLLVREWRQPDQHSRCKQDPLEEKSTRKNGRKSMWTLVIRLLVRSAYVGTYHRSSIQTDSSEAS